MPAEEEPTVRRLLAAWREDCARQRRSLRRAVAVLCDVRCDLWDGPVRFVASDLSPDGMWLQTPLPLDEGEELLVSFSPPGQFLRLHALCEVARVGLFRRAEDLWPSGMGLVFTDLTPADHERLARALIGIPPPLPPHLRLRRQRSVELTWPQVGHGAYQLHDLLA